MTIFEKTAIFIDASSLLYGARALGYEVDFKRLRAAFERQGTVLRAFYYITVFDDAELEACRPLIDWLDYAGFVVTTKLGRQFENGEGRRKVRRNTAIELAVDALEIANRVDHIVLFSDDGDLRRLVKSVQGRGVHVTIVSTLKARPIMLADELRRQADGFIDLDDLRVLIERLQANSSRHTVKDAVPLVNHA